MRIARQADQYPWRTAAHDHLTAPDEEDTPEDADLYLSPDEVSQYFNPYNDLMPGKLDSIRQTIDTDGITHPVQIDTDGIGHARLNDGHHRVTVAQERGLDEIPVVLNMVDKYFFRGKKPEAAPPIQEGLRAYLDAGTITATRTAAHDHLADPYQLLRPGKASVPWHL